MALIFADRVKETATAPGTGAISLGGAVTGFITFSTGIGNANTCYYAVTDNGANWEVGLGTYATSGNTLTRTTVLASSNSGSAVNFTSAITVWVDWPAALATMPTRQVLTSGSAATYTTPANCRQLRIRMVGGGGGGAGAFSNLTPSLTAGSQGGTTTFNSVNAIGGVGAPNTAAGGYSSTAGTGTANFRAIGNAGGWAGNNAQADFSGAGGGGPFGGAPPGQHATAAGISAQANTGAGGSGGANGNTGNSYAGGGQAGEYAELIINNPAGTYTYTVGAGGAGGVADSNGGAGGSGLIIVDEYYSS